MGNLRNLEVKTIFRNEMPDVVLSFVACVCACVCVCIFENQGNSRLGVSKDEHGNICFHFFFYPSENYLGFLNIFCLNLKTLRGL